MTKSKENLNFKIRNIKMDDVKEVFKLLEANRPYVGLNSRYTYLLLARDFSETCLVAEYEGKIVAFSSGYIPPNRRDTFFNWEVVVHENYRGNGLQKILLIKQIIESKVKYFEATVNPSNQTSRRNFHQLAQLLNTTCTECPLFSEEDFENDGHEAEVLFRVGPISQVAAGKLWGMQPSVAI
jgi:L-2,4-diaminobutyric acid acetyltransferase